MRCRYPGSALLIALLVAPLAGCAAPPVQVYTLSPPLAQSPAPGPAAETVFVPRLIVPDEFDTQDILLRDGSRLIRSPNGRWASRLSRAATDLVIARLSQDWPAKFVTGHAPMESAATRLSITIERFDLTTDGKARLVASWTGTPLTETSPAKASPARTSPARTFLAETTQHAMIEAEGPVARDSQRAALLQTLFTKLADRIAAPSGGSR